MINENNSSIETLCKEYLKTNTKTTHLYQILVDLSFHLSNYNNQIQKTIYFYLTFQGILKLVSGIQNDDIVIRKLSSKVLLQILHDNQDNQNIFCEHFNFTPVSNVISINWLPKKMKKRLKINQEILSHIQMSQNITSIPQTFYWKWPNNKQYTDEDLPDPSKYLLGFYYKENKNENEEMNIKEMNEKEEQIIDLEDIIKKIEGEDEFWERTDSESTQVKTKKVKNGKKNPSTSVEMKINRQKYSFNLKIIEERKLKDKKKSYKY